MNFNTLSDHAIEKELGNRIKILRLRKNRQQEDVAKHACLHRNAISNLENGKGTRLSTVIAVLRELNSLDALDAFIPEVKESPLQVAKMKGSSRKRASGEKTSDSGASEW